MCGKSVEKQGVPKTLKRTIRETGRKIPYATTCEFCEKIFEAERNYEKTSCKFRSEKIPNAAACEFCEKIFES